MAKFSLAWDAHKQNLCNGLTALQQNGEFVDMTLAADGHHVKVHQMVISLASPYLKDIITSVQTPHPVVFLTKVSYPIMCSILEYIYTGEVLIEKECLEDLIEAAKELQIKGLEEMTFELPTQESTTKSMAPKSTQGQQLSKQNQEEETKSTNVSENIAQQSYDDDNFEHTFINAMDTDNEDMDCEEEANKSSSKSKTTTKGPEATIQFTVSNQGGIQVILNRFIYCLRYTSVKGPSAHRNWRCIDYNNNRLRCPAQLITKDDEVTKRYAAHNHPFHDKQILKKVSNYVVFSAINDAEVLSRKIKQEKDKSDSEIKSTNDSV